MEGWPAVHGQQVQTSSGSELDALVKKYNNPAGFDKLSSANKKVDLAKQKMAGNLTLAMENSARLEVRLFF